MDDSVAATVSGITGVQVRKKDKTQGTSYVRPFQVAFFRSDCLKPFDQIAKGLIAIELRNCGLVDLEFLAPCTQLRFMSVADNNVSAVPQCIADLEQLQILDLSRNILTDYMDIVGLEKASANLLYISFVGNRITTVPNYRRAVLKVAHSVVAIDNHAVADEELFPKYFRTHGPAFGVCSKRSAIHERLRTCAKCESSLELDRHISFKARAMTTVRLINSPAYIIQRAVRFWLRYVRLKKYFVTISKLQARVRSFLHHHRVRRELSFLMEEVETAQEEEEFEKKAANIAPYVSLIQRKWRDFRRRERESTFATVIQRWYRRVIVIHRGICLWMKRNDIKGLAFASSYVEVVQLFLEVVARQCTPNIAYEITQGVQRIRPLKSVRAVRAARRESGRGRLHCFVCPTGYRADISVSVSKSEVLNDSLDQDSEQSAASLLPPVAVTNHFHRNPAIALFRAMTFPWMRYASAIEKRQLNALKPRGHKFVRFPELFSDRDLGLRCKVQCTPFWKRSSRVVVLPIEDHSILWKVYKRLAHLTSIGDMDNGLVTVSLPLFFDHIVVTGSSVVEIQRIWRGYKARKGRAKTLVKIQIRRRAVILLQRWWKYHTFLKRRLTLLSDISRLCRGINSNVLYLDAWLYYKLLRCFQPPPNQTIMNEFPEYRGIPVFNKQGRIVMQPFAKSGGASSRGKARFPTTPYSNYDRGSGNDDKEIRIPNVSYLRYCIPQWASWRPSTQLPSLNHLPSICTYHQLLVDLISVHCEVSVVHIPVRAIGSSNHSEDVRENEIRVVQLIFSSVHEAQVRCAMLMIQTYDPLSHTAISMMTRETILRRNEILEGPSLLKGDRPHTTSLVGGDENLIPVIESGCDSSNHKTVAPVESLVILADPPPAWLLNRNMSSFQKDTVRFRFLCESLSVRNTWPTSPTQSRPCSTRPRTSGSEMAPERNEIIGAVDNNDQRFNLGMESKQQPILVELECSDAAASHYDPILSDERPEFTSARLQPVALPSRVPVARATSPQRKSRPLSGRAGRVSMDGRLRRHIWSADRVLRWCSNFADDEDDIGDGAVLERAVSASGGVRRSTGLGKAETTASSRLELILKAQYESAFTNTCEGEFLSDMILEDTSELPSPIPRAPVPPLANIKDVLLLSKRQQVSRFQTQQDIVLETARREGEQRLQEMQSKVREAKSDQVRLVNAVNDFKTKRVQAAKTKAILDQSEIVLAKEQNVTMMRLHTAGIVEKTHSDRRRKKKSLQAKQNMMYVGSIFNSMNRHAMISATKNHKVAMRELRCTRVKTARAYKHSTDSIPLVPEEISLDGSKSARDRRPTSPTYTQLSFVNRLIERDKNTADGSVAPMDWSVISKPNKRADASVFNSLTDYVQPSTAASHPHGSKGSLQPLDGSLTQPEGGSTSADSVERSSSHASAAISNKKDISISARINMFEFASVGGSVEGSAIDLGSLPSTPAKPRERVKASGSKVREKLVQSRTMSSNLGDRRQKIKI